MQRSRTSSSNFKVLTMDSEIKRCRLARFHIKVFDSVYITIKYLLSLLFPLHRERLPRLLASSLLYCGRCEYVYPNHRLINNNRQNTRCRLFKIQGVFVHNNPEAEVQKSYEHAFFQSCNSTLFARNYFGLLPQGYCERKTLKS